MVEGHGDIVIDCRPEEVLEFVLDREQHRQVDVKNKKVKSIERSGNTGTVRLKERLERKMA